MLLGEPPSPVSWTVSNIGPAVALNSWYDYVYASADDKLDASDILITSVKAPNTTPLGVGASYTVSQNITLPGAADGKPYLLFVTDRERQQPENNEINNVKAVKALAAPDLKVTAATTPTPNQWGATIPITWTVKNDSTRPANASWYDYIYASSDSTFDSTDIVVAKVKNPNLTPLVGGDSYTNSINLTLPTSAANKPYLFIVADGSNEQIETTDSNNSRAPKATDWLHVATVLDPITGMQLYINGKLQATAATNVRRTAGITNTTFSSATAALSGQLDNISLWNVSKTATEIQSDYQKTFSGTEAGLLRYWQADEGVGSTLTDTVTGTKTGSLKNGTTWAGASVGIGNQTSLVEQRKYTYDIKFNQLTGMTDELGHQTLYGLDINTGNVLKSTRIVGELDTAINGETNDVVTGYTYTSSGQVNLMTDALGHVTDYDYDGYGNLIKTTTAKGTTDEAVEQYEYDLAGNRTASIDALGRRTEYVYGGSTPFGSAPFGSAQGATNNMLLQQIDALGGRTIYNYDKMGRVISVTDANSHVTKMSYDDRGRMTGSLDANGGVNTNTYDNNGNLLTSTDALGRVTSFKYDVRNRLIGTLAVDSLAQPTIPTINTGTAKYDANNNLTKIIDALGNQTQKFYDSRNRVIRSVDAVGNEILYGYDGINQLTSMTDAKGRVTSYQYDELGRLVSTSDALNQTTRTEYDKLGDVTATIDANGNRTEYTYDALNRRVKVKDAKGGITQSVYDKVGNIISIIDPVNNSTTYTYDNLNRLLTDTNSLSKTRSYSYDKVGNKLSTTDRNGRIITNSYDNLNRLTTEKWVDISGAVLNTIVSNYDKIGQLTSSYDLDSKYTYTYDFDNRITSVDNTGTSGVPSVLLSYIYDKNGNTISVNDKINGVNAGTLAYTYDSLDRVTQLTQSGTGVQAKRVNMSYNPIGQIASINRYRDLTGTQLSIGTSYSYDSLNRLTGISHKNEASLTVASYNYSYDNGSRISQIGSVDGTTDYNYDGTNQLTGANYSSSQTDEAYSYDANGNRTNSGYTTGLNNQLLSDGIYNYQYDDEGNRIKRTEVATGKSTEYVWDYRNRLTKVLLKDVGSVLTKNIEYVYDVNDRRIGKKVGTSASLSASGVVERYVLDRDQISLVFDGVGNQTHRYLYGTEVDQVLADESNGQTNWFLSDHQGTIKDIVDGVG